jgi:nitrogenase molybdenum-iron protein alpha/beta subunit
MAATRRFVRQLTELSGGDMARTEAWIETNEQIVGDQVSKMADHFRHVGAAIFADVPLAAGLYTIFHELGIHVRAVGLRDPFQSLGGKITFLETLERNGITETDDTDIIINPSLRAVRERTMELARSRDLQVVIGSTHEMNVLQRQPAAVALSQPTILIETGFPSDRQHATEPSPKLGYAGVAHWAQRLLSAAYAPRVGAPGISA